MIDNKLILDNFLSLGKSVNLHYLNRYIKIVSNVYKCSVYEKHHILPKSLFPSLKKEKSNICKLPLRVHFLVHRILAKALPENNKMILAYYGMANSNKYKFFNSKVYEENRTKALNFIRDIHNERVKNGTHLWATENHPEKLASKNGTHKWLGDNSPNHKKMLDGTHLFIGCTNPGFGVKPWDHPKATRNSLSVWITAIDIYNYIQNNPTHRGYKIIKYFKQEFNIQFPRQPIESFLKRVDTGWNPLEDLDWLKFRTSII